MASRLLLVFALGCGGQSPCERLAPRLMPNPDREFIERCEARYEEPAFARTVDCLLAIEGGPYDEVFARCPGSDELRLMYFHF